MENEEKERDIHITQLPPEVLLQVFSFFSIRDLNSIMLVHHFWYDLIQEEQSLWKCWSYSHPWWFHRKMRANYPNDPIDESKKTWKHLLVDSYSCEMKWKNNKHSVGVIPGIKNEDLEIFHFQDSTLITNSFEGELKVWNLDTLDSVLTFNNPDGEIVWFEFIDNVLASSHLVNSWVNIFDVKTGERIDKFDSTQWVNALCISNSQLICGEVSNVRVWDLNKHAELACISTDSDTNLDIWMVDNIVLCGNDRNIRAYDLRCNGLVKTITDWTSYFWYQWETQTIYTPGSDGSFQAWNVITKELLHTFSGHQLPVSSGHMEDAKFVTCSGERIVVWDLNEKKGILKYSIPTPIAPIWGLATEEHWMVGVNMDNDIYVWHF